MININPVRDIRTCQRIKFNQAIYILTMYEKKIRVKTDYDANKTFDTDEQNEKIVTSWNSKWKMDLTKPILNCVTSVHPRVFYGCFDNQPNKEIAQYNRVMKQFIQRLKIEHEDETNFKIIEEKNIQKRGGAQENDYKLNEIFINKSMKDFLKSSQNMLQNMLQNIEVSNEKIQEKNIEIQSSPYDAFESLKRHIQNFRSSETSYENVCKFGTALMGFMENIKQSEHGSTLVTFQPDVNEITHLIHPFFPAIYGHLLKQKEEQNIKFEMKKESYAKYRQRFTIDMKKKFQENMDSGGTTFKSFFSSSTVNLSKVVFLNLDGYESEFNLEFARCFRKNLLYISFPKEDFHSQNDNNSDFQKRLYKKIMYNYVKNQLKFDEEDIDEEDNEARETCERNALINNLQNYFETVEKEIYDLSKGYEDLNKNLFTFPLRLPTLNENFNILVQESEAKDSIDTSESHLIYQIFWYYMINQIREFNPQFIMVSYSGRLKIEDSHFVEIMQELTKLAQYKVIFFPNLTTYFSPNQNIDHDFKKSDISYKNQMQSHEEMKDQSETKISFNFFNKIVRFLKVSSGSHNLTRLFEEEGLLSKYKHQLVLKRMNRILQVLGNQYENIQKIRFKDRDIELIPKLYEEDINKILKDETLDRLIPRFYINLYELITSLIAVNQGKSDKMDEKRINESFIKISDHRNQIIQLVSFIKEKYSVRHLSDKKERDSEQYRVLLQFFKDFRYRHFMDIAEEKYQEQILLYFKLRPQNKIFSDIQANEEKQKQKKQPFRLNGLVEVSFSYPIKQTKQKLQILDSASVLYSVDHSHSQKNRIPILIMNYLSKSTNFQKFENFCSFLEKKHLQHDENLITRYKHIKVLPLKLFDQDNNEIIENTFKFRTQWNYMETNNFMILYWPAGYDFVESICSQTQGRVYEPSLLHQFYVCDKRTLGDAPQKQSCIKFYRTNITDNIEPRFGCSAYEVNNRLYIFGGFYCKQKNYLNLQQQITKLDFSNYEHNGHRKVVAENMKQTLYGKLQPYKKPNTFVRTRRDFEFYDMSELKEGFVDENGKKTVVMLGGYGQNFLRPFSLVTYYYYILKFNLANGQLESVEKKLIYDRTILINTKDCSKNLGIIKTVNRVKNDRNEITIENEAKLTQLDSYCRFRCSYAFKPSENGEDLVFKYKYMFSQKDQKNVKEHLKNFQEQRHEINQLSNVNIRLQKIQNINNMILMEKYGTKKLIPLRLSLAEKQYQLSQESICYLNIINGIYICAIIKHSVYTQNKSIVVECNLKSIEKDSQGDDDGMFINLKEVDFKPITDLSLHIIEAINPNFFFLLHGYQIFKSEKIKEYRIKNSKEQKKQPTQIQPNPFRYVQDQKIRVCYSSFFYQKTSGKHEICCENFISLEQSFAIVIVEEKFEPTSNELFWKPPYENYKPKQAIFYINNKPTQLEKIKFLEAFKYESKTLLIVQFLKKRYFVILLLSDLRVGEIQKLQLKDWDEAEIRSFEDLDGEKGTILVKTPEQYVDREFITTQQLLS